VVHLDLRAGKETVCISLEECDGDSNRKKATEINFDAIAVMSALTNIKIRGI
jgi:hypothetical protein